MKALRKILGVVVLLLALAFAAAGIAAAHKVGQLPAVAQLAVYTPQLDAAPWWLVGVCGAAALFFLISAVSLLQNSRQAFLPYVAALIASGAVVWWMALPQPLNLAAEASNLPALWAKIAAAAQSPSVLAWASLIVLGLLVALTDRRKRYKPSAE